MEWLLNIQQAGGGERSNPGVVVRAAFWWRTRAALSASTASFLVSRLGLIFHQKKVFIID